MVSAELVRSQQGHSVALKLTGAAGGGTFQGRVVACLESADGLVAYLADADGRTHTIHYQHIAELVPLEKDSEA